MDLPVMPPVKPMLAKSVPGIPDPAKHAGGLSFEPKWDGFRCLVFRDGDEVELTSRNTKPLTRYFPEVVAAVKEQLPERCVLDGELFVASRDGRPARVRGAPGADPPGRLARADAGRGDAGRLRRLRPAGAGRHVVRRPAARPSAGPRSRRRWRASTGPATSPGRRPTRSRRRRWFEQFEGAGLDGVVAKPLGSTYEQNARTMLKIKHARTADVVLAGYRLHKTSTPERPLLGSLLLGLYADDGDAASTSGSRPASPPTRRAELVEELQPAGASDVEDHPWLATGSEWAIANPDRVPGTQSRWSAGKDLSFVPLRPERVLEVGYDHMEGRRFRHTAQFKRWRPDRDPGSCGYEQLEEPVSYDLAECAAA